jgi:7,8-dihydro-6-hydroxymethylpterin-pyrophosphokinase
LQEATGESHAADGDACPHPTAKERSYAVLPLADFASNGLNRGVQEPLWYE